MLSFRWLMNLLRFLLMLVGYGCVFVLIFAYADKPPDEDQNVLPENWAYYPWTGAVDFVATENGVYVLMDVIPTISYWDNEGKLAAMFHAPSKYNHKEVRLAADETGNIYVMDPGGVYMCSDRLTVKTHVAVPKGSDPGWGWKLNEPGKPEMAYGMGEGDAPPGVVKAGSPLFAPGQPGRNGFTCSDGSQLKAVADGLERHYTDGRVITYGMPVWMKLFNFPFPALWIWPVFTLLGLWYGCKKWSYKRTNRETRLRDDFYIESGGPGAPDILMETDTQTPNIKRLLFLPRGKGQLAGLLMPAAIIGMCAVAYPIIAEAVMETIAEYAPYQDTTPLVMGIWTIGLLPVILGISNMVVTFARMSAANPVITVGGENNELLISQRISVPIGNDIHELVYTEERYILHEANFIINKKTSFPGVIALGNGSLKVSGDGGNRSIAQTNSYEAKEKIIAFLENHMQEIGGSRLNISRK